MTLSINDPAALTDLKSNLLDPWDKELVQTDGSNNIVIANPQGTSNGQPPKFRDQFRMNILKTLCESGSRTIIHRITNINLPIPVKEYSTSNTSGTLSNLTANSLFSTDGASSDGGYTAIPFLPEYTNLLSALATRFSADQNTHVYYRAAREGWITSLMHELCHSYLRIKANIASFHYQTIPAIAHIQTPFEQVDYNGDVLSFLRLMVEEFTLDPDPEVIYLSSVRGMTLGRTIFRELPNYTLDLSSSEARAAFERLRTYHATQHGLLHPAARSDWEYLNRCHRVARHIKLTQEQVDSRVPWPDVHGLFPIPAAARVNPSNWGPTVPYPYLNLGSRLVLAIEAWYSSPSTTAQTKSELRQLAYSSDYRRIPDQYQMLNTLNGNTDYLVSARLIIALNLFSLSSAIVTRGVIPRP